MVPAAEHEVSTGGGGEPGEDAEPTISPKELALFVARAIRLNLGLCLIVAAVVGFLGSTVVAAMPTVYEATFKIFIQEGGSLTMSLASGQDRNRKIEGARGLEEFILARDNLLSVVREARLVDTWPNTRSLPLRLKDDAVASIFGPPARKDMERAFVEMLGASITGRTEGESVRVSAQWREPQNAYDIARLVQRNFLASRAAHDLGPIQRAIPFLEEQLQQADLSIEAGVSHVLEAATGKPVSQPTGAQGVKPEAAKDPSLVELASLSKQLADARRQQRALVDPWRKRLVELKAQLTELKVQYSDDHPLVMQAQARIEAASQTPDEVTALKAKETELMAAISARAAAKRPGEEVSVDDPTKDMGGSKDPEEVGLATTKSRLFSALRKGEEISARLESARIELATAEADFDHRYVVIEQPEVPGKPLKGKKPVLFMGVLVASLLLGVLAGALREFRRGRLIESWQVRDIGLPILAEVDLKKLPPGK